MKRIATWITLMILSLFLPTLNAQGGEPEDIECRWSLYVVPSVGFKDINGYAQIFNSEFQSANDFGNEVMMGSGVGISLGLDKWFFSVAVDRFFLDKTINNLDVSIEDQLGTFLFGYDVGRGSYSVIPVASFGTAYSQGVFTPTDVSSDPNASAVPSSYGIQWTQWQVGAGVMAYKEIIMSERYKSLPIQIGFKGHYYLNAFDNDLKDLLGNVLPNTGHLYSSFIQASLFLGISL